MPKNPIVFTLDGRRCTCLLPEGKPKRLYVLCGWEMEKLMMLLAEDAPEVLFFSTEIDGGRDFTPWEAEPIWPGEPFSGGGEDYLKFLTDTALPYLEERFGAPTEPENCALLGVLARRIICALGADENGKIRCRCKPFRLFVVPAVFEIFGELSA